MSKRLDKFKSEVKNLTDADAAKLQSTGNVTTPVGTPENPSSQVFTISNVITFCRFILTIFFLVLFVQEDRRYLALACYAIAAITDFLDGMIARKTQTVSWLGKIMDPVMDRVLLFTGVLGLLVTGKLPLWVAVWVIGRDVYLAIGASVLRKYRRRPVDVVYVGKIATALLMIGFCDLLLGIPEIPSLGLVNVAWLPGLNSEAAALGIFFVYAGCICSFITAVVYTKEGLAIRRDTLANKS